MYFKLFKIVKGFSFLFLIIYFSGCGGGSSTNTPGNSDSSKEEFIFTDTGVSGKLFFSTEIGEKEFEITNIVANQCESEIFSPIRFSLNETTKEIEIPFNISFKNQCYTDKITIYYDIITTLQLADGKDVESRKTYEKEVINPLYSQNIVNDAIGDDPLFKYQWHLKNSGQTVGAIESATPGEDINVTAVWDENFTGQGVTVAVIDEGIDIFHPDLKDNILTDLSYNYHTATTNTTPIVDTYGHGTAVAGLIAAKGWNSIGTRGVAPNASLVSFNALEVYEDEVSQDGYSGALLQTVRVYDSLTRNLDKIDIYNNSWASDEVSINYSDNFDFDNQLTYGVIHGRKGKGAIYVKSAGNGRKNCTNWSELESCDNSNFDQKQTSEFFIVVGAVNSKGTVSSYSTPGSNILVSAPGGEFQEDFLNVNEQMIVTTDMPGDRRGYDKKDDFATIVTHFDVPGNENYDYTQRMGGTSSAAPIVSGVIALMLEANPNLTYRDVRIILAKTARKNDPNNPSWKTNAQGLHFNNDYGFGVVDAKSAVDMAKNFHSVGGYLDINRTSAEGVGYDATDGIFQSSVYIDKNLTVENVIVSFDLNDTLQYYETYDFNNINGNLISNKIHLYAGENKVFIKINDLNGLINSIILKDENNESEINLAQNVVDSYSGVFNISTDGDYYIIADSNSTDWNISIESLKPKIKASNLEIALVSPSGTESILVHAPNGLPDDQRYIGNNLRFFSTHFMEEKSEGNWTLKLREVKNGTFKINHWNIQIEGRE